MKEILTKYGFVNRGPGASALCDRWEHPTGLSICPDASTPTLTCTGVDIYIGPKILPKLETLLKDVLGLKGLSLAERFGWTADGSHWVKGRYRIGGFGLLIDSAGNTIAPWITVNTEKQFAAIEELMK